MRKKSRITKIKIIKLELLTIFHCLKMKVLFIFRRLEGTQPTISHFIAVDNLVRTR